MKKFLMLLLSLTMLSSIDAFVAGRLRSAKDALARKKYQIDCALGKIQNCSQADIDTGEAWITAGIGLGVATAAGTAIGVKAYQNRQHKKTTALGTKEKESDLIRFIRNVEDYSSKVQQGKNPPFNEQMIAQAKNLIQQSNACANLLVILQQIREHGEQYKSAIQQLHELKAKEMPIARHLEKTYQSTKAFMNEKLDQFRKFINNVCIPALDKSR